MCIPGTSSILKIRQKVRQMGNWGKKVYVVHGALIDILVLQHGQWQCLFNHGTRQLEWNLCVQGRFMSTWLVWKGSRHTGQSSCVEVLINFFQLYFPPSFLFLGMNICLSSKLMEALFRPVEEEWAFWVTRGSADLLATSVTEVSEVNQSLILDGQTSSKQVPWCFGS